MLSWLARTRPGRDGPPLVTAAGPVPSRDGWYLECRGEDAGGALVRGVGEAAPWPARGTETALEVAAELSGWPVVGPAPADSTEAAQALAAIGLDRARWPALWAGAEQALLTWLARREGRPLAALLAPPGVVPRDPGLGAALIGAADPAWAAEAARTAVACGHGAIKLKLDGREDLARVAAVRAAVGPRIELRLDANGLWPDVAAARAGLAALAPFAPAFVEQPVPAADVAGLCALALDAPVPVAADEALGRPGALDRLLACEPLLLVVKPALVGGLLAARDLIARAGRRVVLSSALDGAVGEAGLRALAAAHPGLPAPGFGVVAGSRLARLVAPGERLAIWAPNGADWVAAAREAWRLGVVLLPVPPRWTDREAADVFARAAPALVLGSPELAARARGLGWPAMTFEALAALPPAPWPGEPPDGPAAIVPTSGTTGRPKLAVLGRAGLRATAEATAARLALGPGDVWGLPLPLHHVAGLGALLRAELAGAELTLGLEGATHASLVPTSLIDRGGTPLPPALRAAMVGGAAPTPDLAARWPQAWATYGLTEAGGTVTLSPAGDAAGTSGVALPGWEVRVLGADGESLPAGNEGRIAVRGPGLMLGYLDDPEATRAALADGWLHTGDLGRLDAAGRLTVLARRDDLVVCGGENVYPAEVEAALRAHPAIADAAVVGAADPRLGQIVVAFVSGDREAAADLDAFLAERLARYKRPRRLRWLPALPRLTNGKPDRRALRTLADGV